MNLITPAIDAFLASGTCAVLISLLVIKFRARNRTMPIGPKTNAYYASIIRQSSNSGRSPDPAKGSQYQASPRVLPEPVSRNGFDRVPPQKERPMEREPIGNLLAAAPNFQEPGFSNPTAAEAGANLQEVPLNSVSAQALPMSMLPAPGEVAASSPVEVRVVNLDDCKQQEVASVPESAPCDDSEFDYDAFSANPLVDRAGAEATPTALCLWEGDSLSENATAGLNEDEFDPTLTYEPQELPAMGEVRNYLATEEEVEAAGKFERAEISWGEELEAPESIPFVHAEPMEAGPNLLSFHGLKQQPFDVTPDPAYLYFSQSHREALDSISEGIENFRGFMTLVAEPGMGKTTLLNKLMEEWSAKARVVFLFQTQCNSNELLAFILNELEVDHAGMDVVAMHRALNQVLLEEMLRGRRFVLIVDEGQNLQDSVLETIRLLSDFETAHSKLIQIVLAGQPQMVDTLLRPNLVQLRQRIAVLASLKQLNAAEMSEYVEHRLRAAGWKGETLFTPEALGAIAEMSGGVPRTINNLCFNALLKAFTRREQMVGAETVKEIAGKLQLEALARPAERVSLVQPPATPTPEARADGSSAAEIVRALTTALSAMARPAVETPQPIADAAPAAKPDLKPGLVISGKLIEKIKCQGWSRKHEYRLDVSFERDPLTGVSVAERHYCCNFYVGEAEAAGLQVGKPVSIRIEQE
jgi:general secretion pathway protein A